MCCSFVLYILIYYNYIQTNIYQSIFSLQKSKNQKSQKSRKSKKCQTFRLLRDIENYDQWTCLNYPLMYFIIIYCWNMGLIYVVCIVVSHVFSTPKTQENQKFEKYDEQIWSQNNKKAIQEKKPHFQKIFVSQKSKTLSQYCNYIIENMGVRCALSVFLSHFCDTENHC